ncbi:MAG: hypothetical protein RIF32_01545 [Leptospirales bacterium]|jgi:hypothetical protein
MKSYLMVFGGVFGAIIALTFVAPLVILLAGAIGVGGEAVGFGHYFAIFFLGLAALGLAGAPFFAIMNYLEPENPLQISSAIFCIAAGAIVVLAAIVSMFYGFSLMQPVAVVMGVLVALSGLLQGEIIDMEA